MCSEDSKNKFLLAYSELHELLQTFRQSDLTLQKNNIIHEYVKDYGTKNFVKKEEWDQNIKASDISLQNYSSCFEEEGLYLFIRLSFNIIIILEGEVSGFLSTVNFFEDLVKVSDEIVKSNKKDRLKELKENLEKINEKLPSAVYIPFFKSKVHEINEIL